MKSDRTHPNLPARLLPCLALAAVLLAYLPGLHGPALLDDVPNLGPIVDWAQGKADNPLLAERKFGPMGRPISLLSFMGNALVSGGTLWPMKLTNVLLHLLTGVALFGLLDRLLRRDARLANHARALAMATSVLWLALPQHVVTVLYTVQRMTVLAALFSVLGLWAYVAARERMQQARAGAVPLLLLMALCAALAALSKESALVFPLLLLIVEWAFFAPPAGSRRPPLARLVILLVGVLPLVAAIGWIAWHPGIVLSGYEGRDFGLAERVYSQLRVLWEYAWSTFFPLERTANVYNDDYALSHGLFDPPVTALALAGWLAVVAGLWFLRRWRTIVGGVLFFFAGHALESTIFPLEIYFVHRNYLPSMGLLLAAVSTLHLLGQRVPRIARHGALLAAGAFACLALATAARAHLWGDMGRLLKHAEINNPTSLRLHTDRLREALEADDFAGAQREIEAAYQVAPSSEKRTARLWNLFSYCRLGVPLAPDVLDSVAAEPATRITLAANLAMMQLQSSVRAGQCPDLDTAELGRILTAWADQSPQAPAHQYLWEARAVAAGMYAHAGQLDTAFALAQRAFLDSGSRFELGVFAFMMAKSANNDAGAAQVLDRLKQTAKSNDDEQAGVIRELQEMP